MNKIIILLLAAVFQEARLERVSCAYKIACSSDLFQDRLVEMKINHAVQCACKDETCRDLELFLILKGYNSYFVYECYAHTKLLTGISTLDVFQNGSITQISKFNLSPLDEHHSTSCNVKSHSSKLNTIQIYGLLGMTIEVNLSLPSATTTCTSATRVLRNGQEMFSITAIVLFVVSITTVGALLAIGVYLCYKRIRYRRIIAHLKTEQDQHIVFEKVEDDHTPAAVAAAIEPEGSKKKSALLLSSLSKSEKYKDVRFLHPTNDGRHPAETSTAGTTVDTSANSSENKSSSSSSSATSSQTDATSASSQKK